MADHFSGASIQQLHCGKREETHTGMWQDVSNVCMRSSLEVQSEMSRPLGRGKALVTAICSMHKLLTLQHQHQLWSLSFTTAKLVVSVAWEIIIERNVKRAYMAPAPAAIMYVCWKQAIQEVTEHCLQPV